ncbi:MAG: glycoside hydrolase family 3 N-terminal domain-containing protein [Fournierella sp.]|uniref:glycoside hydrolase family 3 protein n=1 Tax=Allofournierella sp. TaxID=1940256 RepID=UPI002A810F3C|nr:glycoside hydrolase family 3 N-terminal domain-containing protein [Fournierella sp.]MDY4165929.1 glycoside hydrolase family 3 N-terminal domain-containing protein [Fournierella sp.]
MVDLKAKPFYLSDEDIRWVRDTIDSMTLEEKIGQLFIMLDRKKDRTESKYIFDNYHIGGCRYQNEPAERIWEQNKFYQENSKIPLLIACNCDNGGSGACSDGTHVATAAACGATGDTQTAYDVGLVSGREGTAVGCNWDFGPVCDLLFNWRNTIVNTRAYGKDPDAVIANCRAYVKGVQESGMAACCKHFPGDGVEELDQHLVMGVNSLSCEEWDATFGKVYQTMIDDGIRSIMVGHIALPAYSRALRPGISDEDIRPATLAPELLTDLLRRKMGYNGLLLTDASHMAGMTCAMPRSLQVPCAIAAGCDMFLFFNDIEEDFGYMMEGYRDGTITPERLDDALMRILGLKASLQLHKKKKSGIIDWNKESLSVVGCTEHQKLAARAADRSITLVKDTKHVLPISAATHKRVCAFVISSAPLSRKNKPDPVKEVVREELERAGYQVHMHDSYYDLVLKEGISLETELRSVIIGKVEEFKKKYDAVFVFINMKGYAQENNVRLSWSIGHSVEIPWYMQEVPTVFISLNYTNHLIDVPMAKTFINAHAPTREVIRQTIEKIAGTSEFHGSYDDNVFCGRWDTRL